LNPRVRTVAEAEVDYKWVRMESNDNPNSWITVREEG
jgi:predicted transglutaminase-like cysteine proteinase